MRFGDKDERETTIRRFALQSIEVPDDIEAELHRGNALWNRFVEISREFQARFDALTADDPTVIAASERAEEAALGYAAVAKERTTQRRERRSRQVDPITADRLKEARAARSAAAAALREAKRQTREREKEELRALEEQRRAEMTRARKASGLYWATANRLLQLFETARGEILRKRASGLPADFVFRRYAGGLLDSQFAGGKTVAQFQEMIRGDKFRITAYSTNTAEPKLLTRERNGKIEQVEWRPAGEKREWDLPLATSKHRQPQPFPDHPDVRVKTVETVLRRNQDWHRAMSAHKKWATKGQRRSGIIVTMTAPAGVLTEAPPGIEPVAINLGWRLMPSGNLRVATIVGLREAPSLPIVETAPLAYAVEIPAAWLDMINAAKELRGHRDRALDAIRPLIRAVPWHKCPHAPTGEFGMRLARAPKFGARALAALTIEWKLECPGWIPESLTRIEAWRQEDNVARHREAALERRYYGERLDLYRRVAKMIGEHATAVLLDDADLSAMARLPRDRDPEMEAAVRARRHLGAPGLLRSEIERAAKARGRQIVKRAGPTSFLCHVGLWRGDRHIVKPALPDDLMHTCTACSRHFGRHIRWNQDVNNCMVQLIEFSSGPDADRAAPAGKAAAD